MSGDFDEAAEMIHHTATGFSHSRAFQCDQCPGFPHAYCAPLSSWNQEVEWRRRVMAERDTLATKVARVEAVLEGFSRTICVDGRGYGKSLAGDLWNDVRAALTEAER